MRSAGGLGLRCAAHADAETHRWSRRIGLFGFAAVLLIGIGGVVLVPSPLDPR
jgi:hypothetical protein